MSGPEKLIENAVRLALSGREGVLLFRNAVVRAEQWTERAGALRKSAPLAGLGIGSADLVGLVTLEGGTGRFFALEIKAPEGRVSPEQLQWLALVRRFGGFAAVVRGVDEAEAAVVRCRKGESE